MLCCNMLWKNTLSLSLYSLWVAHWRDVWCLILRCWYLRRQKWKASGSGDRPRRQWWWWWCSDRLRVGRRSSPAFSRGHQRHVRQRNNDLRVKGQGHVPTRHRGTRQHRVDVRSTGRVDDTGQLPMSRSTPSFHLELDFHLLGNFCRVARVLYRSAI